MIADAPLAGYSDAFKNLLWNNTPQNKREQEGVAAGGDSPQWTLILSIWAAQTGDATFWSVSVVFKREGTIADRLSAPCSTFGWLVGWMDGWMNGWLVGWFDESSMWLPISPFLSYWWCLRWRDSGRWKEAHWCYATHVPRCLYSVSSSFFQAFAAFSILSSALASDRGTLI